MTKLEKGAFVSFCILPGQHPCNETYLCRDYYGVILHENTPYVDVATNYGVAQVTRDRVWPATYTFAGPVRRDWIHL